MPSPKGIALGSKTRKVKVGNLTARVNNGIPRTSLAAFMSGRPFPKPPAHPGKAYKVTQNAKEANRRMRHENLMGSFIRSRSKSVNRAELARAKQRVKESMKRAASRSKSVTKSPHTRKSASPASLGEKYIYFTEGTKQRKIQLKDISLQSDLTELLRAEEVDWLIRHSSTN